MQRGAGLAKIPTDRYVDYSPIFIMKTSQVQTDSITDEISRAFDYEFTGVSTFEPIEIPTIDRVSTIGDEWGIGLIVGPSGTGKSILLSEFGTETPGEWNPNKAVCSHFEDAEDAEDRLSAVGFNSIPSWLKPYHVLSNGEKFRADLARQLGDGAVIDEYTSVVDRNVARSCSVAINKYVKRKGLKNLVFASCHYDIIDWLEPDWIFDTDTKTCEDRRLLRRPDIEVEVLPCGVEAWSMFREHHYLTGDINSGAHCWIAIWNGRPIGFSSVISMPSGSLKRAWREHRTVVLPDFQGLGVGVRLSESIGEILLSQGKRYFSKVAHPKLGAYREASPKWRATSKNKIGGRNDYIKRIEQGIGFGGFSEDLMLRHADRDCFSHEYVGL